MSTLLSLVRRGKKKIISSWLIIAVLCALIPNILLDAPQKADAFFGCQPTPIVPVINPTSVPVYDMGLISLTTSVQLSTSNLSNRKCFLDAIVKAITRAVVHEVTSSIIDWINRGFQGGPSFVTNPTAFFSNIADQEIGKMIDGSALGFVCDPFKLQIQLSFLNQRSRYTSPSRCSITSIINNVQNFVGGDFSQGGWDGWVSLTTKPENNPYGELNLADNALNVQVAGRQNIANTTLNWGKGFQSILDKAGNITTPGTFIEETLHDATGEDLSYLNLQREFDDIVIALADFGINQVMNGGLGH